MLSSKVLVILIGICCIIYWFQTIDDKSKNNKRPNLYDKIKLPLLITLIVALLFMCDTSIMDTSNNNPNIYTDLPDF